MKSRLKLLTLSASLIASGFGIAGNAHANAYAVAANNITDGFVFVGVDTDGNGIPDTINTSAINVISISSLSSSAATLNGTGTSSSDNTAPHDANASNGTGSAPLRVNETTFVSGGGNTYYSLFGQLGTAYSWGDSIIVSEQSATTNLVARNAAESNIPATGFGDADGRNSSSSAVVAAIAVGADCATLTCAISFSFKADPYIRALLDAAAGLGSVARGVLSVNVALRKDGDLVDTFAWAPNGAAGGIFGGTETLDAENLNVTLSALLPGQDFEHSPAYGADGFGSYFAFTNALGTGSYTLSLSMIEKTDVTRVPEPASLALLGIGLSGLALVRRRKEKLA